MSGGALRSILGKLAGPLLKIATPLARKILPTLGLTAAMSAIKYFGISTNRKFIKWKRNI